MAGAIKRYWKGALAVMTGALAAVGGYEVARVCSLNARIEQTRLYCYCDGEVGAIYIEIQKEGRTWSTQRLLADAYGPDGRPVREISLVDDTLRIGGREFRLPLRGVETSRLDGRADGQVFSAVRDMIGGSAPSYSISAAAVPNLVTYTVLEWEGDPWTAQGPKTATFVADGEARLDLEAIAAMEAASAGATPMLPKGCRERFRPSLYEGPALPSLVKCERTVGQVERRLPPRYTVTDAYQLLAYTCTQAWFDAYGYTVTDVVLSSGGRRVRERVSVEQRTAMVPSVDPATGRVLLEMRRPQPLLVRQTRAATAMSTGYESASASLRIDSTTELMFGPGGGRSNENSVFFGWEHDRDKVHFLP